MAVDIIREDLEVLERGQVYFLYRPAVGEQTPHGVVDLQRFYMVLHPEGTETRRLIVVGRKKLPELKAGDRFWAFVDRVGSAECLAKALGPDVRPAGEGVYALVGHHDRVHLEYALSLPEAHGPVQEALNLEMEGAFVVSVKNPEASSPAGMGLDGERKAHFPESLQERFGDRRFIPLATPEFLDVEGCELLLRGIDDEALAEAGFRLEPEDERAGEARVFDDLSVSRTEVTIEPLVKGEWS
jgi:hypothetical protein